MTLPTTNPISQHDNDDDSDIFGPPRSSAPTGHHHHRSRVPMISPKLRLREERKRILQLCAHKLERIKDSEANLRRSVCINNTYCRLTDELRREKQSRYLANLPKSDSKSETAHDNIFSSYNTKNQNLEFCNDRFHHQRSTANIHQDQLQQQSLPQCAMYNNRSSSSSSCTPSSSSSLMISDQITATAITTTTATALVENENLLHDHQYADRMNPLLSSAMSCVSSCAITSSSSSLSPSSSIPTSSIATTVSLLTASHSTSLLSCNKLSTVCDNNATNSIINTNENINNTITTTVNCNNTAICSNSSSNNNHTCTNSSSSCCSVDNDLEILDRELSAINASMPLIDPEITQGAEQLEKAISSRKRSRSEDENDRLVREALSQFYLPTQRLISAIDECPFDIKRTKLSQPLSNLNANNNNNNNNNCLIMSSTAITSIPSSPLLTNNPTDLDLEYGLNLDYSHQTQKEFEVIMDALRLGASSPTPSTSSIDSCGQAAMMSESGVFHNLVVTSLET